MSEDDVPDEKRPRPPRAALDPQREATMEHLQTAFANGKLTLDEFDERMDLVSTAERDRDLEVLLEDIPGNYPLVPASTDAPPATTDGALQLASDVAPLSLTAFFGGVEKEGHWRPPANINVKAIFGGVELDLRDAELQPVTTIHCNAVFGGIDIKLPPHVRVDSTGSGIFGGFSGKNLHTDNSDAPLIRITGRAVFGGVDVKRKRKRRKKRRRRDSSDEYPAIEG